MIQQEVASLNTELTASLRRIDEVGANLVGDSVIAESAARLRTLTRSEASPDQLVGPVREWLARTGEEVASLQKLSSEWEGVEKERHRLSELSRSREDASAEVVAASAALDALRRSDEVSSSTELSKQARDLIALANLGRNLGLQDGHCPLCRSDQDHEHYLQGIATAEDFARRLDQKAAEEAQREQIVRTAEERLAAARRVLTTAEAASAAIQEVVNRFDDLRRVRDSGDLQTLDQIVCVG
ncbi:MAG: hypothetical protein QM795_13395 [Pseudoxanthomonas sp.]